MERKREKDFWDLFDQMSKRRRESTIVKRNFITPLIAISNLID